MTETERINYENVQEALYSVLDVVRRLGIVRDLDPDDAAVLVAASCVYVQATNGKQAMIDMLSEAALAAADEIDMLENARSATQAAADAYGIGKVKS